MPVNNDVSRNESTIVRARRVTDQTGLINGNLTSLSFPTEDWDADNAWDGFQYVAPVSGFYRFELLLRLVFTGTITSGDIQYVIKAGSVGYGIKRYAFSGSLPIFFDGAFYYGFISAGAIVVPQIYLNIGGATALKVECSGTPATFGIIRY